MDDNSTNNLGDNYDVSVPKKIRQTNKKGYLKKYKGPVSSDQIQGPAVSGSVKGGNGCADNTAG